MLNQVKGNALSRPLGEHLTTLGLWTLYILFNQLIFTLVIGIGSEQTTWSSRPLVNKAKQQQTTVLMGFSGVRAGFPDLTTHIVGSDREVDYPKTASYKRSFFLSAGATLAADNAVDEHHRTINRSWHPQKAEHRSQCPRGYRSSVQQLW